MKSKINLKFVLELEAYGDLVSTDESIEGQKTENYEYDGETYEVIEYSNGKVECNQIWK